MIRLLALCFCCLGFPLWAGGTYRVLLAGDSWAAYMWEDGVLRATFAAEGFPEFWEKGDVTAISGSTAQEWATPEFLQRITDELTAHPSIDVVQLSLGGNDFLAGASGGGWHTGMSALEEEALFDQVAEWIQITVDHCLAFDARIQVLLSFYDYPNFQETLAGGINFFCINLHNDLGQPTPRQLNEVQTRFTDRMSLLTAGQERVTTVRHLGLMQYHFGYPSQNIEPGELLPPGDLDLPSPPEAMRLGGFDCFHLNATGYRHLAQNLWDHFYIDQVCVSDERFYEAVANWPMQSVPELVSLFAGRCVELVDE